MVKIFISHSSSDSEIAKLVADLLRSAMCLSKSDIRCTSVDGYRLPAGANTDEQLRKEVLEAQVLVGLISHQSFESAYVLFELGARWGTNSFMVPLLTPGVSTSILKGPLSGLNALSCDSRSQIHQLVTDVSSVLANVELEPAASYQDQVDSLASYKVSEKESTQTPTISTKVTQKKVEDNKSESFQSSGIEKDLLIIKQHCESEWRDDFVMRAHCEKEQKSALEKLQTIACEDIPKDVFEKIRIKAAREWPTDFIMRLHTEIEQIEAYRELHS